VKTLFLMNILMFEFFYTVNIRVFLFLDHKIYLAYLFLFD